MAKMSIQEIRQHVANKQAQNEKKFIPMEGTESDVYIFPDDPDVIPEGEYTFYAFRVRHQDKEKTWRLFDNQVVDLDDALKRHKDRIVHVARAKGSKKIIIT